jgi:hypothetical protein
MHWRSRSSNWSHRPIDLYWRNHPEAGPPWHSGVWRLLQFVVTAELMACQSSFFGLPVNKYCQDYLGIGEKTIKSNKVLHTLPHSRLGNEVLEAVAWTVTMNLWTFSPLCSPRSHLLYSVIGANNDFDQPTFSKEVAKLRTNILRLTGEFVVQSERVSCHVIRVVRLFASTRDAFIQATD